MILLAAFFVALLLGQAGTSAEARVFYGRVVRVGLESPVRYHPDLAAEMERAYEPLSPEVEKAVKDHVLAFMKADGLSLANPPATVNISEGDFPSADEPGLLKNGQLSYTEASKFAAHCAAQLPAKSLGKSADFSYAMVRLSCNAENPLWQSAVIGLTLKNAQVIDFHLNIGDLPTVKIGK